MSSIESWSAVAMPSKLRRVAHLTAIVALTYIIARKYQLVADRSQLWMMLVLSSWAGIASLWFT